MSKLNPFVIKIRVPRGETKSNLKNHIIVQGHNQSVSIESRKVNKRNLGLLPSHLGLLAVKAIDLHQGHILDHRNQGHQATKTSGQM